jgi:hypothetical protein
VSDDTPGIKMGPIGVMFVAGSFMALVVVLHIFGKFAR